MARKQNQTHVMNAAAGARIIRRVAAKEATLFFASPIAWLFLATFAAVSLFVFFWGESFFARNIADVRPLFEWMPVLLIFLAGALTMRLWSEERRTGTLEHVLTQSAPLWQFVLGKFFACLFLLCIALAITLPLPVTVTLIGELDWGPVAAGYLATILLGAAYLSIGLFVSARSDNQIVSLIVSSLLCGAFYLLGAPVITDLFGNQMGEWLRLAGTGSRFDAITRGVLDLRDLYYYLSIIAVFLTLNTYMLEKGRWAKRGGAAKHRRWRRLTLLLACNFLAANLWLGQMQSLRIDVTEGNQYSISNATRGYLAQLQEPLLLRGYFSAKTHPLLSPLVPQLRDLMREYEIAGRGGVKLEFFDPITEPDLEKEANQKYGIQPIPFQVEDRYQSSIVSSYFHILVQYGDEVQVLGFNDLIEVKVRGVSGVEVQLRNPEHDLTRAIKKTLRGYQSGGKLFDTIVGELKFEGFISAPQRLPENLRAFKKDVTEVVGELQKRSAGRLQVAFHEPEAGGGQMAQLIQERYGFHAMAAGLFSQARFYFYLIVSQGEQVVQIPVEDLNRDKFERNLKAAVKRFAAGFTKTVGIVTPQPDATQAAQAAQQARASSEFLSLQQFLAKELNVESVDLAGGVVPGTVDVLVVAGATETSDRELFAIDQFLMQGGTVIAATSPFSAQLNQRVLSLSRTENKLGEWLAHHGLNMPEKLVMDPQHAKFPVPVSRSVGGFSIQEIRMLNYPYFIDVRGDGLGNNAITAGLPQILAPWASPIEVDASGEHEITTILQSSAGAWLSDSTDIMPRLTSDGSSGFARAEAAGAQTLGVVSRGRFESWFADKPSPLLAEEESGADDESESEDEAALQFSGVIAHSPQSARIILFSSGDLLRDQVMQLVGTTQRSAFLSNLQLLANAVDWALEDEGLAGIRGRGHFNRTLPPMEQNTKLFWEYLNYALAALALGLVALMRRLRKKHWQRRQIKLLAARGAR